MSRPAAELAREAFTLWRGWGLPLGGDSAHHSDDVHAFLRWAAVFQARCGELGAIDGARLSDAVANSFGNGRLVAPGRLILAGFDELTP